MSFLRNIASLAIRGGVDDADCADCPTLLPGQDPAFASAVTALGAKLSKADGRSHPIEFKTFSDFFQSDAGAERNVERLYDLARQTTLGFEGYAKRLAKRYRRCPQILEDVLDGLFHIASADGVVTADELDYLEQVGGLFGLSSLTFRRLKATHLGAEADDPYVVLGIPHDVSDAQVHDAWKRLLSDAHPDRAAARGLPTEFIEVAEAKSSAINAAYHSVMRERKELAPV
jgi:DnaJ like chaperone protein